MVVEQSRGPKANTVRAFVSVTRDRARSYTSIADAMSDDELRAQVVATAWDELAAWRRRYEGLSEFAKVFGAIDKGMPRALSAARKGGRSTTRQARLGRAR